MSASVLSNELPSPQIICDMAKGIVDENLMHLESMVGFDSLAGFDSVH
jgi:hypothetical protein